MDSMHALMILGVDLCLHIWFWECNDSCMGDVFEHDYMAIIAIGSFDRSYRY